MKPGKPLAFGLIGETPLLGLPGNPVAAGVSFVLFGRPPSCGCQVIATWPRRCGGHDD
jgi:molybdopterin molybdotransferase